MLYAGLGRTRRNIISMSAEANAQPLKQFYDGRGRTISWSECDENTLSRGESVSMNF
jgi:hypothetical protein